MGLSKEELDKLVMYGETDSMAVRALGWYETFAEQETFLRNNMIREIVSLMDALGAMRRALHLDDLEGPPIDLDTPYRMVKHYQTRLVESERGLDATAELIRDTIFRTKE